VAGVRPPDDVRTRLRRALGDALKARDAGAVSALRSAMSAIGNAEAVEPGPGRPAATGSAHFAGAVSLCPPARGPKAETVPFPAWSPRPQ
jgi:hypothetical protein